jgi:hypothetical protein
MASVLARKACMALGVAGLSFVLAPLSEAASVYSCSRDGRKCVIKLEDGIVGDRVNILDEKARVIANGRIIKRKGAYGVIAVADVAKTIRRGYPVIVRIEGRDSNLEWAASFSNQE